MRQGLLENNVVLSTALVDMYAKCGALSKSQQVLEELPIQNVHSWSVLIVEYVQQGKGHDALNYFEQMQQEGLSPKAVTYTCILKACGIVGAAKKGEQTHNEIFRQGLLGNDIMLGTTLVDMYYKCGTLAKAARGASYWGCDFLECINCRIRPTRSREEVSELFQIDASKGPYSRDCHIFLCAQCMQELRSPRGGPNVFFQYVLKIWH